VVKPKLTIDTYVTELSGVSLTSEERSWLEKRCPYFTSSYLDFLSSLRLDPTTQVEVTFIPVRDSQSDMGDLELKVKGVWSEVILYEASPSIATLHAYIWSAL
jgi:nicotinate phosphoribosyltransferase